MSKQISLWQRARQMPQAIQHAWKSIGEGSWRGPFFGTSELGNSFQLSPWEDGWQRGLDINAKTAERFGPFYACVTILSQEQSRIDIQHLRTTETGERKQVLNKAPARVFRKPNHFQTRSDFMLHMMRSLLVDGNCYAVATRNDRFEVESLYPIHPKRMRPYIVDGEVFYRLGDQTVQELAQLEADQWFPARDVLHVRLFCPAHPLIGESPITAAMFPAATGMTINAHTAHFFRNMSRPSGVLRYPGKLGASAPLQEAAIKRIKQRFVEITQGNHTGEPLVLQENGEWKPMTMSGVDSEIIASFKLTERQIAQVFRVPPFLLGDLDKASFQNVESLSRFFVSSALGFYLDHFELAFSKFFNLPPTESIHFDVEAALLRADMKERADAIAKFIQNGIMSPNEGRLREGLPPVKDGDEPRVQQQLVPLAWGMGLQPDAVAGSGTADKPPAEPAADAEEEDEEDEEAKHVAAAYIARKAIEKAMYS